MTKRMPTLIVVEDNPLILLSMEQMAVDAGWSVIGTATDEMTAARLLKQSQPDLAILDIELSHSTSLGIAQRCRETGIAVLFVTGYIAADLPDGCGDTPVLAKPFTQHELELSLQRAIDHPFQGGYAVAQG